MDEIQFVLRDRKASRNDFWTIGYDPSTGQILSIEPGEFKSPSSLVIDYARIRDILKGKQNQNDFIVDFNENLGAIDLVDLRKPNEYKKKHVWRAWLSAGEHQGSILSPIKITLFNDSGILRLEASRQWTTRIKENIDHGNITDDFFIFITDYEDPHLLFDKVQVSLDDIINRGFWEKRLWSFMNHEHVQSILYGNQRIRINMSPIADSLFFTRSRAYFPYSGVSDEQTTISHLGKGKHISVYVKDGRLWAQSHYEKGSTIDNLVGDLKIALLKEDDPAYFEAWSAMPALMLRQEIPFEIYPNWPHSTPPQLLYKANNIDIGVINENPN